MTTIIQAASLNKPVYQGIHGNLSVAYSENDLKAVAVGTQIDILSMPTGARIPTVSIVSTSGLGAGVTMDILLDGVAVLSDVDVSAPISHSKGLSPAPLAKQTTMSIVLNGAVATGDLTISPLYTCEGSL